ncbi:hypothetical protein ACIRSS_11220 [Amycolatopsis sp. NPDC101161]|uniref:hypothetical protein n=1 Tax=Amycolatopsis sp. NPDC101161 TaxID=3363940 RepID=UPI00380B829D
MLSPVPAALAPAAPGSAPWWGVPVIAGGFLLAGAVIAFLATSLSDRRRLNREDRRQWDRDIRDAYLEITRYFGRITAFRYQVLTDEGDRRSRYQAGAEALAGLREQVAMLEVIGTPAVIARAHELEDRSAAVISLWHELINPGKPEYRALNAARNELLDAVKDSVRGARRS